MSDTPAVDTLAAALAELRKVTNLSLGQIETYGRAQQPPVNLGRSKTSPWFTGKSVPEAGRPFTVLVDYLEGRAQQKVGRPKWGVGRWERLRKAAAEERRLQPSDSDTAEPPPAATVSDAPVAPVGLPSDSDRLKAARLLNLLPHDGPWRTWLRKAPTLFRIPLSVSHPVCDAYEALEDDALDYVDPVLQEAHEAVMAGLEEFYGELNGMHDVSDEGKPVLEMSYPGTEAERNDLNRQACQARDGFLDAYRSLVNLLNARGLLSPGEPVQHGAKSQGGGDGTPDIGVELLAGANLKDGRIITIPVGLAGQEGRQIFSEPYYLTVKAANRGVHDVEIEGVRIELDYGAEAPVPYIFPADGIGGRKQLPFRLGSHAGGKAMANAAELGHAVARLGRDHRAMPRRVRAVAWTGSGIDFEGAWIEMKDVAPLLLKALRGGSE
ncbi:hypothetical protein AW27_023250 [Streptomyces sp. PCS3-D2]|uniref:hypothetical protein n=1 Tax=Streptomyces sp. PCS3-D2 TaxID=1460244 RepID=UPI000451BF89|nr:hypothetical protein [Streptomyces sp. PCS3-D2]WKV74162.1 hypothetical protein AW27_023250 [Streptomyces sp. PCS3-D2]